MFCLVSRLKALAILQNWARTLERLLGKATPELFFFKEYLKTKSKTETFDGKKVKLIFTECLYFLGIVQGSGLAKSSCKRPHSTHLWFCRLESHATTTGFYYSSTSSHRRFLNEAVCLCSNKAWCSKRGGRTDLACRL